MPAADLASPPPALDDGRSPWSRLPGALGAAADPRSLVLAVLGLILTRVGLAASGELLLGRPAGVGLDRRVVAGIVDLPVGGAWFGMAARVVADGWLVLIRPVFACLRPGGGNAAFAQSAFGVAWALLVWGVIGGAIGRIAVVGASGAVEGVGLMTAARFALRRAGALVGAPAGILLAVAVLSIPGALLGLLFRLESPGGRAIGGLLAAVPVLLAVPSAVLLLGLLACWPLMVLTVAAEGEDGFEAISRSSSYVTRRAGCFAGAVVASWALGALGLMLVGAFAGVVVDLAAWSLALGGPDDRIGRAFGGSDPIAGIWAGAVGLVADAWAFSYFWSAFARIFLLLRREVDGTPWGDVYRPGEDAEPFAPDPPRPEERPEGA